MKLYLPGLSDGSYDLCRKQLELVDGLLDKPVKNRSRLLEIKQILDEHPAAARLLEAEFGDNYLKIWNQLTLVSPRSLERVLDQQPADSGNKRTQVEWFDYWDKINDGRVMASMGDLYVAFKQLKRDYEQDAPREKAQAQILLASLREDFDWPDKSNWLISSTRLTYRADSLEGTITQHYGCKLPELITGIQLVIPVYRDSALSQVANSSEGLKYLQALLNTGDDAEKVMQTLEFVSGKDRNQIKVWTAADDGTSARRNYAHRATGFNYRNVNFHIDGSSINTNFPGRSRGVEVKTTS